VTAVVFHKVTGSGNDFVMLDGRTTTPEDWPAERIVRICDRRDGIGADGLVILTPEGDNTVRMTFWNSDGSRAAMCGNAALCSTRLSAALEIGDPRGMTMATDAGSFPVRCVGEGHLAELNLPDVEIPAEVGIPVEAGERWMRLGTVGVPHLVTLVEDVATVDLDTRGRLLRHHAECGKYGANSNFVSRISRSTGTGGAGDSRWAIRTFERGVEGETLACGTGTVTAAIALAVTGEDELPLRFRSGSGRILSVSARIEGSRATDIWLAGEGRLVARGVWFDDGGPASP
jgi:diaminopimelate epimerase